MGGADGRLKRAYVSFKTGNIYVLGQGCWLCNLQHEIDDGDGMFIIVSSDRVEAMRYSNYRPVKFCSSDIPRKPLRLNETMELLKIAMRMEAEQ